MGIAVQQRVLFEQLRQMNPDVVDDGVADEEEYLSAKYRIIYVLKEVNGGNGWSLCEHLRNGGRQQTHDATWDNIARWTEGILNLPYEKAWSYFESDCASRRKQMLRKICAVNVKKISGGYESQKSIAKSKAIELDL